MKNKQHKYILKAFLESKIPTAIRQYEPHLVSVDSVIAGYCEELLKAKGTIKIEIIGDSLITNEESNTISNLINICSGTQKEELIIYYRLIKLTETVIYSYA